MHYRNIKRKAEMGALALLFLAGTAGTGAYAASAEDQLLLHLAFEEGAGTVAADSSGNLPDGEVDYLFEQAVYKGNLDPQWRKSGVEGGSLLFDGTSTCIAWDPEDI